MTTIYKHLGLMNCSDHSLATLIASFSFFFISIPLTVHSQSRLTINLVRGTESDSAVIHFYGEGMSPYVDNVDAEEKFGGSFSLYTRGSNGEYLTSIGLSHFDCDENIVLQFFNATEGHYSLEFSHHNTFPAQVSIQLIDNFEHTATIVVDQSVYPFDVTSDPASYNLDRFEIRFQATPASQDFKLRGSQRCHGLDGEIEIANTQPDIVYSIVQDNALVASIVGKGDTIRYIVPAVMLEVGINSFQVIAGFAYCQTDNYKNVSVVVNPVFTTPVVSGYRCDAGSLELKATAIPGGGHLNWYASQDSETPITSDTLSTFKTPLLHHTTKYYVSTTTVFGCEGPRQAVDAEITMQKPAAITASGDTLRSNYAFGNQWYLNGELIPGAISQDHIAKESGIYSVSVNIRSCSSTADFFYGESDHFIISAHPNPVETTVTLQVLGNVGSMGDVQVLNTVGKHVATVQLYAEGDQLVGHVDMSNFPVGIYVVRARGDKSRELKLIKL